MKNQWKLIVSILILILVVIFSLQNTNDVLVDLFFAKFSVPLVLVILVSLLLGVIVGLIASVSAIHHNKKERSKMQKEINTLKETSLRDIADKDKEITDLRTQIKNLKLEKQNTATVSVEEPVLDNGEN